MPSAEFGFCPTCGLANPLAARRCTSCGGKLGEATVGVASGEFGDWLTEQGSAQPTTTGPVMARPRSMATVAIVLALVALVAAPVLAVVAQVVNSTGRAEPRPFLVGPRDPDRRLSRTVAIGEQVIGDDGFSLMVADFAAAAAGPGPLGSPAAGTTFAVSNVEVCLPAHSTPVSFMSFALGTADGDTVQPNITARPQGAADNFRIALPGGCTRGALVFAVPAGSTPTSVLLVTTVVLQAALPAPLAIDVDWRLPG